MCDWFGQRGYGCDDLYLVGVLMSKVGSGETKNLLLCSFCGKNQHEVCKLIACVYRKPRPF